MPALSLTGLILFGYAASMWWLLRRESASALLGLAALCAVSLSLRLVYTDDFPAGLNEDEPKILGCAAGDLQGGRLWVESCTGLPVLLNALFQAQLIPVTGPNRWAIRSYSLVTSVLAGPAAFAVGRAVGFAVGSSFALAGFVAVLPWSLFYGRISIGGELVFHEMLLLAALARLIFAEGGQAASGSTVGGWAALAVGSFGQSLLLYDYFCGRLLAPITVVAAALAKGRRRVMCLAIPVLALLSWTPYLRTNPTNGIRGVLINLVDEGFFTHPLETLWRRTTMTLKALVYPAGLDSFLTVRAVAMHPPLVLVLAALGMLAVLRRPRFASFTAAGFLIGIAPAVVTMSLFPSGHRMLMAYPFIALAACAALDIIPWRILRVAVTWCVVAVVGVQSVALYFSAKFWSPGSRQTFDWETTALVDALPMPPHARMVVMRQVGYFFDPHARVDPNYELLAAENWFPPSGSPSIYAFTGQAALLLPFYESLLGPERVETFGRAFLARFEPRDWSWLRQHGWTYEARCNDTVTHGAVPTLFHPRMDVRELPCDKPITVVWRGRWLGPAMRLRLLFSGRAVVEVAGTQVVGATGGESARNFSVQPDTSITVAVTDYQPLWVALVEQTPAGERLPPWERVSPAGVDEGVSAAQ